MLGARLTVDGYGVMVGANEETFGEKRRFGKLAVGDKKGEEAEGRERRGGGLAMDANFYQRDFL